MTDQSLPELTKATLSGERLLSQVDEPLYNLVRDRIITRSDGAALLTEAAQADVP